VSALDLTRSQPKRAHAVRLNRTLTRNRRHPPDTDIIAWYQEEDPTCTGNSYTSNPWAIRQDGVCAVQTRDNTYSGRARFPAPFNTANTWPTPTPSTTPSASPDLSKFGRLSAPAAAPAAAADPTGAIVGGIIGGVAAIAAALFVRHVLRQKHLDEKRRELERQAEETAGSSVAINPVALEIKKQQYASPGRAGRR
jgi:hypothetical protein